MLKKKVKEPCKLCGKLFFPAGMGMHVRKHTKDREAGKEIALAQELTANNPDTEQKERQQERIEFNYRQALEESSKDNAVLRDQNTQLRDAVRSLCDAMRSLLAERF